MWSLLQIPGKRVVSAFDYRRVCEEWGDASLLFVAHREEILQQSKTVFQNVLKDGNFGELMVAGRRPRDGQARIRIDSIACGSDAT